MRIQTEQNEFYALTYRPPANRFEAWRQRWWPAWALRLWPLHYGPPIPIRYDQHAPKGMYYWKRED